MAQTIFPTSGINIEKRRRGHPREKNGFDKIS